MAPRGTTAAAAVAALCGVAAACVLLTATGIGRPAPQAELLDIPKPQYREQQLGLKAASYVRRWSEQAQQAAMSPKEQILALKAQGVPIIFPSKVSDESGNLQKMVSLICVQKLCLEENSGGGHGVSADGHCRRLRRTVSCVATIFPLHMCGNRQPDIVLGCDSSNRRRWQRCRSLPSMLSLLLSHQSLRASAEHARPWRDSRQCAQDAHARRLWMMRVNPKRTSS